MIAVMVSPSSILDVVLVPYNIAKKGWGGGGGEGEGEEAFC